MKKKNSCMTVSHQELEKFLNPIDILLHIIIFQIFSPKTLKLSLLKHAPIANVIIKRSCYNILHNTCKYIVVVCSGDGKLFLQHRKWPAWNADTSSVPPVGLITLLPKSWTRAWDKPFPVLPTVVIYLLMMPQSCKLLSQTVKSITLYMVNITWFFRELDLLGHLSLGNH